MKRNLLLLSVGLLIGSAAVIRSQQGGGIGPGIGPGPSWLRYTAKNEEFSVTLPVVPAMTTASIPRKSDGKFRGLKRLTTVFNRVDYTIECFENPEPKQSLAQFFEELGPIGEYKDDPATRRRVTIDGFDGIEFSAEKNDVAVMVQYVATEKHLYRFIARGPVTERLAVTEFFSSIKLGKDPQGTEVAEYLSEKIYVGREVDVKARLLTKPEPSYTEDARKNEISGTVVLKVVFSKSGQVTNIRTVAGLPYGLTEQAIKAARKIKFTPAMKDGQPVSMWMQLEYNFLP
jgi:TonB family protein